MGDYPSKHHSADIHQHVRPYYVHMDLHPFLSLELLSLVLGEGVLKHWGIPTKVEPLYQVFPITKHEISPAISLEQLILPISTDTNISQTEIT